MLSQYIKFTRSRGLLIFKFGLRRNFFYFCKFRRRGSDLMSNRRNTYTNYRVEQGKVTLLKRGEFPMHNGTLFWLYRVLLKQNRFLVKKNMNSFIIHTWADKALPGTVRKLSLCSFFQDFYNIGLYDNLILKFNDILHMLNIAWLLKRKINLVHK